MSPTFYYFFSSVPQVLAGILALFAVFTIFKLQAMENNLVGFGDEILIDLNRNRQRRKKIMAVPEINITRLEKAVARKDLREIFYQLGQITNIVDTESYREQNRVFIHRNNNRKAIIRLTIMTSFFTAIWILYCLIILPFADCLVDNPGFVNTSYILVVIGSSISIGLIIYIISRSLKDEPLKVYNKSRRDNSGSSSTTTTTTTTS